MLTVSASLVGCVSGKKNGIEIERTGCEIGIKTEDATITRRMNACVHMHMLCMLC